MHLLLTAATTGVDLSPLWLQYGAIGLVCAILIVFAVKAYQRESQRADRLEQEVARLNQAIIDSARSAGEQISSMREMINFLKIAHHPDIDKMIGGS